MCWRFPLLISHLLLSDEGYGLGFTPGPSSLTSPGCVSLIGRTGNISQDSLWSPQSRFSGTGLRKFELTVHSCSEKFLLCQNGVFFHTERTGTVCPEIRARIIEIVFEIKNELERKEAWILNPMTQFRQRQEAPEDLNPQHRKLPEIP